MDGFHFAKHAYVSYLSLSQCVELLTDSRREGLVKLASERDEFCLVFEKGGGMTKMSMKCSFFESESGLWGAKIMVDSVVLCTVHVTR
jgi:nitrite reductase/ring-hydroxylating ferredoxin subunit